MNDTSENILFDLLGNSPTKKDVTSVISTMKEYFYLTNKCQFMLLSVIQIYNVDSLYDIINSIVSYLEIIYEIRNVITSFEFTLSKFEFDRHIGQHPIEKHEGQEESIKWELNILKCILHHWNKKETMLIICFKSGHFETIKMLYESNFNFLSKFLIDLNSDRKKTHIHKKYFTSIELLLREYKFKRLHSYINGEHNIQYLESIKIIINSICTNDSSEEVLLKLPQEIFGLRCALDILDQYGIEYHTYHKCIQEWAEMFVHAVANDDIDMMSEIISFGFDINTKYDQYDISFPCISHRCRGTMSEMVLSYKQPQTLQYLLNNGAILVNDPLSFFHFYSQFTHREMNCLAIVLRKMLELNLCIDEKYMENLDYFAKRSKEELNDSRIENILCLYHRNSFMLVYDGIVDDTITNDNGLNSIMDYLLDEFQVRDICGYLYS